MRRFYVLLVVCQFSVYYPVFGNNDSIVICGMKLKVQEIQSDKRTSKLRLEYGLSVIREFYRNGNLREESYCVQDSIPVLRKNYYDRKGRIKQIETVNFDNFGLCYVLKQIQKREIWGPHIYIDKFPRYRIGFSDFWFVGHDTLINETNYRIGIVIKNYNGEVNAYKKSAKEEEEDVYEFKMVVEEMPEFPGGEEALRDYLNSNIELSSDSIIPGKVFVSFKVDSSGNVVNAKVLRGINEKQNREALRIINSMPNWEPGKIRGRPVSVNYYVPVVFRKEE